MRSVMIRVKATQSRVAHLLAQQCSDGSKPSRRDEQGSRCGPVAVVERTGPRLQHSFFFNFFFLVPTAGSGLYSAFETRARQLNRAKPTRNFSLASCLVGLTCESMLCICTPRNFLV